MNISTSEKPNLHTKKSWYCGKWSATPSILRFLNQWNQHHIWRMVTDRWDAWKLLSLTGTGQWKSPNLPLPQCWVHHTTNASRDWYNWSYKVLPHHPYSGHKPWLTACFRASLSLQRKVILPNQQDKKEDFQEFINPETTNFYPTGINDFFLLAKICWLCPLLISRCVGLNYVFK